MGGRDAFFTELGDGFASAIAAVYPEGSRILVVCGTGRNGAVGCRAATALAARGFDVSVFLGVEEAPAFLAENGIGHISFVPSTAAYYWDLLVDAVLGLGYDGDDVRDSAWVPYECLLRSHLPIVSVDVPSGWNVDDGPRAIDLRTDDFVKPRLLVSLGKPKTCARRFAGALHYVYDWEKVADGERVAELFTSNAKEFVGHNGEVYGHPGMFNATLFTKRESKRDWVYPEDDQSGELWDELE